MTFLGWIRLVDLVVAVVVGAQNFTEDQVDYFTFIFCKLLWVVLDSFLARFLELISWFLNRFDLLLVVLPRFNFVLEFELRFANDVLLFLLDLEVAVILQDQFDLR